jgi:quercetin dioxygenase-like cupin family protein
MKTDIFFNEASSSWETPTEGISRQIMGYNDQLMMVKVRFKKGAVGYLHEHFHAQSTYVASGVFEIEIAGEKKILKAGDGFFVHPNTVHGVVCLDDGVLIDAFSPMRSDFLKSPH